MIKRLLFALIIFFCLILISNLVSAVIINEIEINPEGGKQEKEWIEFYNEDSEEVDISGFMIYDGLASEKKRYTFPENSVISSEDYLTIEFSSSVLNNGGDYIILKDKDGEEIDKTEELKEESASSKTWQLCDNNWEFLEETNEDKNSCESEKENEEDSMKERIEENKTNKSTEENVEELSSSEENKPVIFEEIKLNSKGIKTEENNEENSKNKTFLGLVGFCLALGILFLIRKRRYKKNEFG